MNLLRKQMKNSCPFPPQSVQVWPVARDPAGFQLEQNGTLLFQRLVCPFLVSTKVDTDNNSIIPETNLVGARWWETGEFVSGWLDIPANKEKEGCLGILIPSNLFKCHLVP